VSRFSTHQKKVTLGVKMSEPCAGRILSTLVLALTSSGGEPVVAYDVVLGQVTGTFQEVPTGPSSWGSCCQESLERNKK